MKENTGRLLFGMLLIFVGASFFVDQLGINLGFNLFSLWPLFLVALGLSLIIRNSWLGGLLLLFLGVGFLSSNFLSFSIFSLWPLIIIFFGIMVLVRPKEQWNPSTATVTSQIINESIVFWGIDKKVQSESFKGGKLDCVFGGGKLDLREVQIAPEGATLSLNCIFGGIEVLVSDQMRIQTDGSGAFGGWENNFRSSSDETLPILRLTGSAVFGGISIKN